MGRINLTKKFLGNGSRLILSDDPDRTYISDGYWMAKRDIFRQHELLPNFENTRGISVADVNRGLGSRGAMISNGYGDLKEKCFRIAHMGDLTVDDLKWLAAQIEDILGL